MGGYFFYFFCIFTFIPVPLSSLSLSFVSPMSYLMSFRSCGFSPFSIGITCTSRGEERANLSAFRTFVRFVLVWICRFPFLLVSGKGCGLTSYVILVNETS